MKLKHVLTIASATDAGLVRNFNEDSVAVDEDFGLVVLADGMGGYKAGDVASGMATMIISNTLKDKLNKSVGKSNGVEVGATPYHIQDHDIIEVAGTRLEFFYK